MRCLAVKEDGKWVAQGVEHDICTQGDTLRQTLDRFKQTAVLYGKEIDQIAAPPAAVLHRFRAKKATIVEFEDVTRQAMGTA